jgi:D-alanyl-D-alanine carboxypeptidase/D-alanyl-D-alanine-endopeptidase (penicillin-binding protein 4)
VRRAALLLLLLAALPARGEEANARTAEALQKLLLANAPAPETYGIDIRDARTGESIFKAAATTPRLPASTMKLFTTGAAWLLLGEGYRFETKALAGGGPTGDGVLSGDLILLGGGDPTLEVRGGADDERALVDELAARIARSGVKRIAGDLVLDDSRFDRELRHPTWPGNQLDKWYCAPVSALTVARSCLTLVVRPGAAAGAPAVVSQRPASGAYRLENAITTTAKKSEQVIIVDFDEARNVVRARGKIWDQGGGYDAEVAVPDPTMFFGRVLQQALVRAGVALGGDVVARPGAAAELTEPVLLAQVSTPLLDVLRITNRRSQNLFAECLLKTLGVVQTGAGSFRAGAAVTGALVTRLGVPAEEFRQVDGSGLSRENLVSPRAMTTILAHVFNTGDPVGFMGTLPSGGAESGSLRNRLADLGGEVRAKTGTIRGVSCLAGYVRGESGRVYAFAVLVNDPAMGTSRARDLQDGICRILRRER